jgi:hypothetical protein
MIAGWIECVAVDYGGIENSYDRAVVSSIRFASTDRFFDHILNDCGSSEILLRIGYVALRENRS